MRASSPFGRVRHEKSRAVAPRAARFARHSKGRGCSQARPCSVFVTFRQCDGTCSNSIFVQNSSAYHLFINSFLSGAQTIAQTVINACWSSNCLKQLALVHALIASSWSCWPGWASQRVYIEKSRSDLGPTINKGDPARWTTLLAEATFCLLFKSVRR